MRYRIVEERDIILNKNFFYAEVSYLYGIPSTWEYMRLSSKRYSSFDKIKEDLTFYIEGKGRKYHKV